MPRSSNDGLIKRHHAVATLFREATFFPGLNIRVASLETTRRIIEEQLEVARHFEITRLRGAHDAIGADLHPDDKELDLSELERQVTHLLPKVFRGGFLITLWSVLERCTNDIATRAGERAGKPITQRLFRYKPFLVAADLALQEAVQLEAFPDPAVRESLKQLGVVRNALVHHDGRQREFPPPWSGLNAEQLAVRGLNLVRDYDFSYLVPTEAYLESNTALVVQYIHSTAARVFHALEPQ